jgi:hypothetical protein
MGKSIISEPEKQQGNTKYGVKVGDVVGVRVLVGVKVGVGVRVLVVVTVGVGVGVDAKQDPIVVT